MSASAALALNGPMGPASPAVSLDLMRRPALDANVPGRPRPITYVPPAEPTWLLTLRHVGLTLMTFGVWHFWGRAEMRRTLYNSIRIGGRPLDYTGDGKEGFFSFLVAALTTVCIVGLTLSVFSVSSGGFGGGGAPAIEEIRWYRLSITLPLLFLMGSAAYRNRHYILRRTWIDGARFQLTGHPYAYAARHFASAFAVGITLGWAGPWRASWLEARKINETTYGDGQRLIAKPDLVPLYKAFALLWFGGGLIYVTTLVVLAQFIGPEILAAVSRLSLQPLADPTVRQTGLTILGIGLVPVVLAILNYRTAWIEHRINAITTNTGRLRLRLPRFGFLMLTLGNAAITLASLGLLAPIAHDRTARYIIAHLEVEGDLGLTSSAT